MIKNLILEKRRNFSKRKMTKNLILKEKINLTKKIEVKNQNLMTRKNLLDLPIILNILVKKQMM
tara:strand:- start:201 stop:392 length:192 start_codon:yes stop_codon:yes gene_type:complete